MPPDAIFSEPRLAAVYDFFDAPRDDLAAYVAITAELGARSVLDVGCGTGSLAVLLAAQGISVFAVDPADASLAVARRKDRDDRVRWLHGDATMLPHVDADLAVMTGNVAQVFLTDDDWAETLAAIHSALRPGGHFVFETRRPEARAWEQWAAGRAVRDADIEGVGAVRQAFELTEVQLPFVSFRYTYTFGADGVSIVSESTLRFRERDELESSLVAAGFRVVDIRDAPDRPHKELVVVAQCR